MEPFPGKCKCALLPSVLKSGVGLSQKYQIKFVPVRIMKIYGTRRQAPLIPNLGSRWASFQLHFDSFNLGERAPVLMPDRVGPRATLNT